MDASMGKVTNLCRKISMRMMTKEEWKLITLI
jgi:hypothetical protein